MIVDLHGDRFERARAFDPDDHPAVERVGAVQAEPLDQHVVGEKPSNGGSMPEGSG